MEDGRRSVVCGFSVCSLFLGLRFSLHYDRMSTDRARPWSDMPVIKPSTARRSSRLLGKTASAPVIQVPTLPIESKPAPRVKRVKIEAAPPSLPPLLPDDQVYQCTTIEQPVLPFSLDTAKAHLCRVDPRFKALFAQMELKVYDEMYRGDVKQLNLFRTLTTSILGQQISWRAARSILYKFCRLFEPSMPSVDEIHVAAVDKEQWPFPTPRQVLQVSDEALRSAGLSGAKIKYVRDVARRFADGRLDVRKIVQMDPEACIAELTQVKGVGRWTAEMLLMFAMRSPDILPVGDLGVQRGMVHFYMADHHGPTITEAKRQATYTPSALDTHTDLPYPTTTVTRSTLAQRARGQKTSKKMYLDPEEMHALALPWAPYRSVACMFMWSIDS